jgi:hypothetical protein
VRVTDPAYTWFDPAGREPEQTRLERQAALNDPITRHVLDVAAIGAGMRVLDLGSGAGDVAIMLSRLAPVLSRGGITTRTNSTSTRWSIASTRTPTGRAPPLHRQAVAHGGAWTRI